MTAMAQAMSTRFHLGHDMARFCACAAEAAEGCLLTAIARDSTNTDLKAAAFEVLVAHISDLKKALAASDIQPESELGRGILKLARTAFCTRYYGLLAALGPDGAT